MPRRPDATAPARASSKGLSRGAVVEAAIQIADRDGIDAVSMRKLAVHFGVDPMSLYHHVRDKGDLLASMVDTVVAGIHTDLPDGAWTERIRHLILSARATVLRHPWSARAIEDLAQPTPAALRHMNTVVGIMRDGDLSLDLTHHALHVLGSRVLGFSQDLFDDSPDARPEPAVAAAQAAVWMTELPHLAELAMGATHDGALGGCDDDHEFAFSLDLILDGLERRRAAGE